MPQRRYPIGTILFFLFSAFTLLELWILVLLTRATSLGFTILMTVVSAIVGASLAKHEGLAVMRRAQQELNAGRIPARPLADGVMVLIGGALLITPGLITDLIGFSTLIPVLRNLYVRVLLGWAKRHFQVVGNAARGSHGPGGVRFYSFTNTASPREEASTYHNESVQVLDLDRDEKSSEGTPQIRAVPPSDHDVVDVEYEEDDRQ